MNLRKACLILPLVCVAAPTANSAELESVSRSFFRQQGVGGYWEATVKCSNHEEALILRRESNQEVWCQEGERNSCDRSKAKLAAALCAQLNSTPKQSDKKPLIKERMAIDQELLEIQERKLQLRRQELKLQKNSVDQSTN